MSMSRVLNSRYHHDGGTTLSHLSKLIDILPADILEEIFVSTVASRWGDSDIDLGDETWYNGTRYPFTVAQVCHRWRTIALSSGRLWGHIDPSAPVVAFNFLSRSKEAPLKVCWKRNTPYTESPPVWLRPHAGRIRELLVDMEGAEINALLLFIGRELPSLEHLHISAWEHSGKNRIYLGLHTPRLYLLQLENVTVNILDLEHLCRETLSLRILKMLSVTIESCPKVPESQPGERILQNLILCSLTQCTGIHLLLNTLQFGGDIKIFGGSPSNLTDPAALTPATKKLIGSAYQHTFMQIGLGRCGSLRTRQSGGSTLSIRFDELPVFHGALKTIGSDMFHNWASVANLILGNDHEVLEAPVTPSITNVSLDVCTALLRQLSSLRMLMVKDVPLRVLSDLYVEDLETPSSTNADSHANLPFPCPLLHTLYVVDPRLADTGSFAPTAPDALLLLQLTLQRREYGVPLEVIYLKDDKAFLDVGRKWESE